MTQATETPTTRRPLTTILAACEAHTRMLTSAGRLIDHLECRETQMESGDLAPIRSVIRTATEALETLHAEAWAVILAERAEAHAKRVPGPADGMMLKLTRTRLKEMAEEALASLAELDRLDAVHGATPAA